MTTHLVFVRHGSHDLLDRTLCGRMPGVVLSERGREEALRAAAGLGGARIAAVYASPLERAGETAAVIAAALGQSPIVDPALNEVDVGSWTGESFEALKGHPAWPHWNSARAQARAPGGESMLEVQIRVAAFMERIAAAHPDKTIVAVSHADVIKAAICHALGLGLDHQHRMEIAPASQTTLSLDPWGLRVMAMNAASA